MSNPLFKVMCIGTSTGGGGGGEDTDIGTKNNPYIWSDIIDPSYSYWTHFINVNPGEGVWIKVELGYGYTWVIGVSLEAEDGSYVDSYVQLYDYNFNQQDSSTNVPDDYLMVDGLQVGSAFDYFAMYSRRLLY